MSNLWHRIQHRFGWQLGKPVTWRVPGHPTGRIMTAFRCDQCGQLDGIDIVPDRITHPRT